MALHFTILDTIAPCIPVTAGCSLSGQYLHTGPTVMSILCIVHLITKSSMGKLSRARLPNFQPWAPTKNTLIKYAEDESRHHVSLVGIGCLVSGAFSCERSKHISFSIVIVEPSRVVLCRNAPSLIVSTLR